ncbi:MAG: thiol:disulfide interchange protein DsbA/DsbL [Gammaproteobacteria bacterium]|nr:thiol:disulfide interchange protein DsbA/DsbL [Gammaproteobacteria bacterium]
MKRLAIFAALMAFAGTALAQGGQFREGVHYTKLDQAASARKPEAVVVTEIFSYGCHACNEFEPFIQSWKARQAEDVKFNRLPVGFGRAQWNLLAKGYLMAEILGVENDTHQPLMDAIWKEGLWNRGTQIRSVEQLADFYASQGVDRDKFMALDGGFMLNMREKRNADMLSVYQPRQTPTMIVAGKYKVSTGQNVPSYQAMLTIVDHLVAQERALLAPVAEAPEAADAEGETETIAEK